MSSVLIALASFPPLLVMLIVIHELGHYITARLFGVKVMEIGLGYPPRACAIYRGRTDVRITPRTQPLGDFSLDALQPGQVIRVLSDEITPGILEARYVEPVRRRQSLLRNLARARRARHDQPHVPTENHLTHEGRIRSVSAEGIILADTAYSLNWLPLGGFVRVAGESNPQVPQGLASKPAWQRIIVLASSAGMNALFPIVAFTLVFMLPYQHSSGGTLTVAAVAPDSPAYHAGLQVNDRITAVNDQPIADTGQLRRQTNQAGGQPIVWQIARAGELIQVEITPRLDPPPGQGAVGVTYRYAPDETTGKTRIRPPWEAAQLGAVGTWNTATIMAQEIWGSINQGRAEVMGPIGIAHSTGQITSQQGFHGWLVIAIIMSINLAVVNLLPIPMLDGGRLLFVLIECARGGKPVPAHREHLVHMVGFVALLALIIAVSAKDLIVIAQAAAIP